MFANVHSQQVDQDIGSVPTLDLAEDLLRLAKRTSGTKLERRMTELEKAQISERIKDARQQAGLTQEELADLLHVRARTIANYEAGRIPWRLLGQIAEITGVSQEWLLHGPQAMQPAPIAVMQEALDNQRAMAARLDSIDSRLESLEGAAARIVDVATRTLELLLAEQETRQAGRG